MIEQKGMTFDHGFSYDDPGRHDLKSRFLLFILLFFFPLFLGVNRKWERNNQSRDFKSCLSGSSLVILFPFSRPSYKKREDEKDNE